LTRQDEALRLGSGVFVKGDYTLVEDARREALDKIEAAARDEHIVEKAQTNAEASIREFLRSLGYQEVLEISFQALGDT
jgi:hypothetical protein